MFRKFDHVIDLSRNRLIDALCLTEPCHDAEGAVLGRLHCAGLSVVDSLRPRIVDADPLSVSHGGIVILADPGVVLSPIAVWDSPTTFELVCVRAFIEQFAVTVVVLYRP